MKKLLFGLIATMMLSTGSFSQVKKDEPKTESPIELEFGRVSKNCGGFGICKFKIHLTVEELTTIIAAFSKPDGTIKALMSPDFYKRNAAKFPGNYLQVDEDYTIDKETTRALGVADGYTIKKGKYMVVFDKSTNTYNCTF